MEVAAAFNAAAEALGVRGKELVGVHRHSHARDHAVDGAAAGLGMESATGAGGGAGAPDAEHPRDQQAPSPTSSAPRKSVTTWWPACWLGSVAPLWQVRGGDEGSRQQQQHEDLAAASTMPVNAGPHSVVSTHTAGATNSLPSSSPLSSKHLSTCRQRRSHCAGPQQAASEEVNCSVHQLLVSAAGRLQILGARCCPTWLRRALPVLVRSIIVFEFAFAITTMAAHWLMLFVLFTAAKLFSTSV
ncbi:hypothetical protein TSOC_003124 [Tetrabaena socialis]|uniref:Uncharacterized protein n=1 Tax=Tetrabaena socialis TaxID=47790 RepID=A0A2J8ACC9_9CHLO|nr:hypothetical protein TSOC_003124 [Tetrabaena socialis]|eukprot:PNH10174.1 hypothetical protein TSOC_003124 [Tetrabaena socialis]